MKPVLLFGACRPAASRLGGAPLFVMALLALLASGFRAQAQSRVIVGYFQNWNNASAPYIRLRDVNAKYNVIDVAFATPVSSSDMTMTFTPTQQSQAEFISDIKALQAQGRKVLISIGGADAPVELRSASDKSKFVSSMQSLVNTYGFDGLDIDLEGSSVILDNGDTNFKSPTTPKIVNLIAAARELTTSYTSQGKAFWLTSAPETQYTQGGYGNYGSAFGGYLPVLYGLRDILTFVHVQYYNTGSQNATDGKVYSQGTPDFIVAMTDMLLKGFPVAGNASNVFPALRQDQVAFGLPATGTGAAPAGGYVTPADVTKALNYLVKGTSFGGQYMLNTTYPNLRGIMTWSVNWDKSQGDAFVTNAYNFFSTLGNSPSNQAPSVSLTSPTAGASYTAPASISLSANASDADGTISKVDFYQGSTLLFSDTSSPYAYTWTGVAAGTYSITARATDNAGAVTTSSAVSVTVKASGSTAQAIPGKIEAESFSTQSGTQTETTTDTGGGLNVDYYETNDYLDYSVSVSAAGTYTLGLRVASATGGATLQLRTSSGTVLGSVSVGNTGGWQSWQTLTTSVSLPAGPQTLRLFAQASTGCNVNWLSFAQASAPANQAPSVSLTSPTAGTSYTAPASLSLSASASDADGTISKVDFYQGSTLLFSDTSSPYAYTWTGVAAGTYSLTARATDNAGAVTTAAAVSVTVKAGSSGCAGPAWVASKAYVAGDQAVSGGQLYQAKWWSQGEEPATHSCTDCAWKLVGPCAANRPAAPAASTATPAEVGELALHVYPNPVAGGQLHLALGQPCQQVQAQLSDALGRGVAQASATQAAQVSLTLPALASGFYLLRVQADGHNFTQKIVVP